MKGLLQEPRHRIRRFNLLAVAAIAGALVFVSATGVATAAEGRPLTVFAAASTTSALQEVAADYESRGHPAPRLVFASSGVLARQITGGAPADLYLSANVRWMEWLVDQGVVSGPPVDLLGNRLVLVEPAEHTVALKLDASLPGRLEEKRLAIGDPAHVPAGLYAKAALEALGLWSRLADRTVRMPNVRAALLLVERGEVGAGIVYVTDAAITDRVRVAATFPAESHPPIVYPAAIVAGGRIEAAEAFLHFLQGEAAATIFRRHGFAVE